MIVFLSLHDPHFVYLNFSSFSYCFGCSMDGGGDEGDEGVGSQDGFTFDTNIASMHTYLGGKFLSPCFMWFMYTELDSSFSWLLKFH